MRGSSDRFALWLHTPITGSADEWLEPHYCSMNGMLTVATSKEVQFGKEGTSIYMVIEVPPEKRKELTRYVFDQFDHCRQDLTWKEYEAAFQSFFDKGGVLIRNWLVFKPAQIVWDDDGEEDFWAMPESCEGWEKVEQQIRKVEEEHKRLVAPKE